MKKDRGVQNILFSSRLKIILILLIVCLAFYLGRELYWQFQARKELKKMQETKKSLIKENENLSQTLKQVKSPEFIEREAREQFGFQKPGEKVIIIVPQKND